MFLDDKPFGRDADHQDHAGFGGRCVPIYRQVLNVIGCALAIPLYYLTTAHSRYPVTLDIVITIALTEFNRYVIEGHRSAFRGRYLGFSDHDSEVSTEKEHNIFDIEKRPISAKLECLAAVVGWREDPSLYARALESYKTSGACVFLLAGIDGDEEEDQEMVKVFNRVRNRISHQFPFWRRH